MKSLVPIVVAVLLVGALAACGGSAPQQSSSGSLTDKTPNLKGQTLSIVNSAPPDVTDTVIYLTIQTLKKWGANVHLDNVQGDPDAVRAVLSRHDDVSARSPASTDITSNLTAFGASHPRTDYVMAASSSIGSIKKLPGHNFAVSNTGGLEAAMYHAELAAHKIPENRVPLIISGTASARAAALLAGKIDATFVHADSFPTLKQHGIARIADVAKDVPELAAGYWSATQSWLSSHAQLAVAIDMAWLMAARTFQTDEKAYVAAALAYTGGAQPRTYFEQYYQVVKAADVWPDDGSGFSVQAIDYNAKLAYTTKATDRQASASQWTTTKYWKQAVANVLQKG